jgi:cytochrome c oxidase assembly protein Cox11
MSTVRQNSRRDVALIIITAVIGVVATAFAAVAAYFMFMM